jgi:hypothetical protein
VSALAGCRCTCWRAAALVCALDWRDRPCAAAPGSSAAIEPAPAPRDDRPSWLVAHGQTDQLIDLLWEPLAVAALNEID